MGSIYGFLAPLPAGTAVPALNAMISAHYPVSGDDHGTRVLVTNAGATITDRGHATPCVAQQIGDLIVVYEGGLYWAESTPAEIRTSTLTEGLALAYRKLGPALLEHLRGTYAIAILQPELRRALLATDRMGIRPLAYGITGDGLVFASSALAVTRFPGINGALSPQAIHDYLFFHMVPSPETIFRGVSKIPPAHCAQYDNGRLTLTRYWQPDFTTASSSESALALQLRERLEGAMSRQFDTATSSTTGAFLSGGLDSSTVVGLLAERSSTPVTAYTIGFDAEGYDEIPFARESANHYGSRLCEYYVTPDDVANAISTIAQAYDEPFGNASVIPAYICARLARDDGRTLLMAGDGGDELFGGNERYLTQKIFSYFETAPSFARDILKATLLSNTLGDSIPPIRKVRSYVRQAVIPLPDRLHSYNFLRRTLATEIFDADFISQVDMTRPERDQREVFQFPKHADTLQRLLFLDWKYTLADNDLRKVNQACDIAGIEVRYPFLDDDLVTFSTTVPSDLLIRNNSLRDFYKRSLAGFLPPHTIGKKKHGFGLPFGIWMARDPRLNALAIDSLNGMKQRNIIKASYIDHIIQAQRTEHAAYYGVMIWVIVMLEQWLRAQQR